MVLFWSRVVVEVSSAAGWGRQADSGVVKVRAKDSIGNSLATNVSSKGWTSGVSPAKHKTKTVAKSDLTSTEKYRPKVPNDIIGNQSLVKQHHDWLTNWNKQFLDTGNKKKGKKQNDSGAKKAVLLSGTPGIGKTTSAKLVSQMLDFQAIEVNASDNGGKADAKIEKGIGGSNANSIKELVSNEAFSVNMDRSKHPKTVLIMDEVDGMSAGDRGGVADLIASIKISKIPIICICNDRYSQKLKSLVNYCLLLSFRKPTNQQLLSALYLPFLSSFLTDHSFPLVSALLSFPDIQVAMEKGAPLRSKRKEDKLKGKDDSSTKPKSTRKVQFNFEGSPEYKTSSLPKSLGKDDTPFPKGKGGGKGDKIANGRRSTVSKEPQPLELKVEQDLPENVKCMMDCEALDILQGIQDQLPILSKDPEFRLPVPFDKGLQYAKRGVHYANPQAVRQVLEDLTKYGVSNSEICVIANVCPESDEEVFSLLPSLKTHFWSFWNHIY
ncbi:hypothetical protein CMV_000681 [Castanea mollissima]|uniref:AAA+ ATPase domain-containing protein n=1 Tax=Castanea mollissima TaxID=60419 RepID=A0A8J4RYU5_9ROSI|nr:hypothetical protein CMV_000681 [Castanea mollissima]